MQLLRPLRKPSALEVEEIIIDQLQNEVGVLRRCALVCRAWHLRSRVHLLRRIQVRTITDLDELCTYFRRHPFLSPSVRSVHIRPVPASDHPYLRSRCHGGKLVWVPLVSLLPNLNQLKLSHWDGSEYLSLHPIILKTLRLSLCALDTLVLSTMTFRTAMDVIRLISACPAVRTLRFVHVRSQGAYTDVAQTSTRAQDATIERCSRQVSVSRLYVEGPVPIDVMEPLLKGTRHSLKRLATRPSDCLSVAIQLTTLQAIEFFLYSEYDEGRFLRRLHTTCSMLRKIETTSLYYVGLYLCDTSPHHLAAWLSTTAAVDGFALLEEAIISLSPDAVVNIDVPNTKRDCTELFCETLPRLLPKISRAGNLRCALQRSLSSSPSARPTGTSGHDGFVKQLKMSPDGHWAVTCCPGDGPAGPTLILWDVVHDMAVPSFLPDLSWNLTFWFMKFKIPWHSPSNW
ncbi:hypothetical protein C8Q76DRAFT_295045 [Earliella scabrosa]|nr:hypothetical protein C8Q76DRAFT_295045 [Earliella scabrosa]